MVSDCFALLLYLSVMALTYDKNDLYIFTKRYTSPLHRRSRFSGSVSKLICSEVLIPT